MGNLFIQSLQQKSDAIRAKASGARQKVEEAKASQQASTSQNAVLDGLTRLKAAGRIHGFHVRVCLFLDSTELTQHFGIGTTG